MRPTSLRSSQTLYATAVSRTTIPITVFTRETTMYVVMFNASRLYGVAMSIRGHIGFRRLPLRIFHDGIQAARIAPQSPGSKQRVMRRHDQACFLQIFRAALQ